MARHLIMCIVLLSAFANIGAAQNCNGTPLHGAPIEGANLDAYTASGQVIVQSEGPTGTFTCTMNITVPRFQPVFVLRYQEFWFRYDPRTILCGGDYCKNTITVTLSGPGISDIETFSADGVMRPPGGANPPWALLSVPGGELWGRTVVKTIDVSGATQLADATLQFSITDVVPSYTESVSGTFSAGGLINILDPVPDLQDGNQIIADPECLAVLGTPVTGIAADGAARVVLRIRASQPGQSITLYLLNDQGAVSSSATADGTLATIQGVPASGQVQLTAVNTLAGPMAFALYEPPIDFDRSGTDDNSPSRTVSFKITSASGPPNVVTSPFIIWRPPVMLVHGLWGGRADWNTFTPFITDGRFSDSQFSVRRADYNIPTAGAVSASIPGYSASVLSRASTNALGFGFNAPIVLDQIQEAVVDFRRLRQAAATQVDVIAHSMGGTTTRTLEYLPQFTNGASFGVGSVHKLITIGTPHLGSPLAIQLIQSNNTCIRNLLADGGNVAFFTATVAGVPNVSGGDGDLQGDGFGGTLSFALNAIQPANGHEVATALIAGTMTANNTNSLSSTFSAAGYIRYECRGNPLADNLTPAGWPTVFGQPSDAIVPRLSQVNNNMSGGEVSGLIHSPGVTRLSFTGPSELDPLGGVNTVQTLVIQFLNASTQSSSFFRLP
jgi:pimeloyl-ACP methyl ester carboxylesterase